MFPKFLCTFLVILAASFGAPRLHAQEANDKPIVSVAANVKYGPIPNAPECFTVAVERGDPSQGPSVILARFAQVAWLRFTGIRPVRQLWSLAGPLRFK